ncbi:MAG: putative baseplate assembly protein [Methanotrichaceae archaeon]
MRYFCCDETRKTELMKKSLNGIDFLEVLDEPGNPLDQRMLYLHCFKPLAKGPLTKKNLIIEGGERIRNISIKDPVPGKSPEVLNIEVDPVGDLSIYTLKILQPDAIGFDPLFSSIDFLFRIRCSNEFDCIKERICQEKPQQGPDIDYLAKDYASFRRLILDRISSLIPDWREHNPSDLGIALIELLAYIGDYLSYRQDAVSTEAYLGTARKRISVRRHARLVDYFLNDGCNSRVWLQVWVDEDTVLPKSTKILTPVEGLPKVISNDNDCSRALIQNPEIFETMHQMELYKAHNEMKFYTWENGRCCLPRGATKATLQDDIENRLKLLPGDVLIFEERIGPGAVDGDLKKASLLADHTHRHAVRLISVTPEAERDKQSGRRLAGDIVRDPLNGNPIVEIEWHSEDALPFPLCISTREFPENVSIALGNVVLADHGLTVKDEILEKVQASSYEPFANLEGNYCDEAEYRVIHPRFNPSLQKMPVTNVVPYNESNLLASCKSAITMDPKEAIPAISLSTAQNNPAEWFSVHDLLNIGLEKNFVAEIESDGSATLRFGDNIHGRRPDPGTEFYATYRVGSGTQGNVGAETLAHIFSSDGCIKAVRNPMSAKGGLDPESLEEVRQNAPYAFRTQERAVTQEDYADVTERLPLVQKAEATFRWTGSWHTVFLTVDRQGGIEVDDDFKEEVRGYIERYRMAGHDIEVDGPIFVPLELEVYVCVSPDYFKSDVKEALILAFSNGVLPDGSLGLFHPDNFTFGRPVYLSSIYSAAQSIQGVAWVKVTKFRRLGDIYDYDLDKGILEMGRLEIARLDNDPNFPEHGIFNPIVEGGK